VGRLVFAYLDSQSHNIGAYVSTDSRRRDGTISALVPLTGIFILMFAPTLYISLDTSMSWTSAFRFSSTTAPEVRATALFVLTLIWPAL
jgi:hypothetical protein